MSKSGNIRILRDGLTTAHAVYRKGDIVPPREQTARLRELADGERHVGHVWAEWVDGIPKHTEVTEPVGVPENLSPIPARQSSLEDLIVERLAAGESKGAIVRDLRKLDEYTEKQVLAEFDRLLAIGRIASGPSGYTVA